MKPWILAIDTSTEACSCALGNGDSQLQRYTDVPRKHAEKVLPMVDELLFEAGISPSQLDAIAFGRGPGAFTGLRIAASMVQGLAFSLDIPVIPISSLQALAQRGFREYQYEAVIAAIDARMGEIYWGAYQLNTEKLMLPCSDEQLTIPGQMQISDDNHKMAWQGVGTGWQYQNQMLPPLTQLKDIQANVFTHAIDILTLARPQFEQHNLLPAEQALPVYIRNNVTHQKSGK